MKIEHRQPEHVNRIRSDHNSPTSIQQSGGPKESRSVGLISDSVSMSGELALVSGSSQSTESRQARINQLASAVHAGSYSAEAMDISRALLDKQFYL